MRGLLPRFSHTTILHSPTLILWAACDPDILARFPEAERNALLKERHQVAAENALRERELRVVLHGLGAIGLPPVLLKGAALMAAGVYPDPALRPMGDLDLWLLPDYIPRALGILERLGYRPIEKEERPNALRMRYEQEVELRAIRPGGSVVDLHYWPFQGWWHLLAANIPQRDVWQRRRTLHRDGITFAVLAPEDHLLHLLFHFVVNHHLGTPGIRALIDVALSLDAWSVDWDIVVHRASAWRIRTVTWVGLYLLDGVFPDVVPPRVLATLRPPAWQRKLLQPLLPDLEALIIPRMITGRRRYLLKLALCDSPRAWLRLMRWAAWPERRWLEARYGERRNLTRLRHTWRVFTQPRF